MRSSSGVVIGLIANFSTSTLSTCEVIHADRLKSRFWPFWLREEKPYSLCWTLKRYDRLFARNDQAPAGLESTSAAPREKRALPPAGDIGL